MNTTTKEQKYFYGNPVSDYGMQYGYVDYRTLAKSFYAVLNNDIMDKTAEIGYWDIFCGADYDEETDEYNEFYQFYIVSDSGARILEEAKETVWYNEELDMYVWGVTHWGTSWDYVLTDIVINTEEEE